VADVVLALGVQVNDDDGERTRFLDLCSRVQQALVGRVHLGTQYFRQKWTPILGHKLALVVVQLRSRCFWNKDTLRDEVSVGTATLAAESDCHSGWLRKAYKGDWAQSFFVVTEQGRGRRPPTFKVTLREPLTEGDEPEYQALLNAGVIVPDTGQLGLTESSSETPANGTGERLVDLDAPGERLRSRPPRSATGILPTATVEKGRDFTPERVLQDLGGLSACQAE